MGPQSLSIAIGAATGATAWTAIAAAAGAGAATETGWATEAGAGAATGAGKAATGAIATVSPFADSTAIGVFTATPSVPSGTRIWANLPASTASISIVALSVSISARTSPARTSSPTFFSQRASFPSVMVGLSAGIRICVAMRQPSTRISVQSSAGSGSGLD